jgi:hypothetical protein
MKALSIRQPWAWLILHAGKDIENRDWSTSVRGPVLIHAAKGMTRDEYEDGVDTLETAMRTRRDQDKVFLPPFEELERGGIVGQMEIAACVSNHVSPWFFGRFGFVLANPKPLPFTPYRGQLGFFEVAHEGGSIRG